MQLLGHGPAKNTPEWAAAALCGAIWPTTSVKHTGARWKVFLPRYFANALDGTLRPYASKLKGPTLIDLAPVLEIL